MLVVVAVGVAVVALGMASIAWSLRRIRQDALTFERTKGGVAVTGRGRSRRRGFGTSFNTIPFGSVLHELTSGARIYAHEDELERLRRFLRDNGWSVDEGAAP